MSTPFYDLASLVVVPSGYKSGKIYAQKPLTTDGQLTFTRASTATRVNASGLIETVSSGVPRLDYQGSTCPKLLLEPQRTNVILRSQEQTDAQYAAVINEIASRVAVANPLTGANNAYKITSTANSDPYMGQVVTGLSNGNNTFSLWLWTDSGQSTEATLFFYNAAVTEVYSKVITLTTTPTRYTHSVNFASIGASATVRLDLRQTGAATYLYTYGWQAEGGAYATSYIPTTSAAVTRLADDCLKANTFLSGQTVACAFIDYTANQLPTAYAGIFEYRNNATLDFYMLQYANSTTTEFRVRGTNGVANTITAPLPVGRNKVAMYRNGDRLVVFLNGTKIADITSGTPMSAFATTSENLYLNYDPAFAAYGNQLKVAETLLFAGQTFTDAQLAELTTL
jgi:hypothetical protein